MKRFKLRNLDVDRVDLVDKGANQHAEIVIIKGHDEARARIAKNLKEGYPVDTQLKNGPPPVARIARIARKKRKKRKKGAKGSATPERNAAESSTSAGSAPVAKHTPGGKGHDQKRHDPTKGKGAGREGMSRKEIKDFIDRDKGDAPVSRYGRKHRDWGPIAFQAAMAMENATGEPTTEDGLDHIISLVVNDHDDIQYILDNYGENPKASRGGFARPGGGRPSDEGLQEGMLDEKLIGEFDVKGKFKKARPPFPTKSAGKPTDTRQAVPAGSPVPGKPADPLTAPGQVDPASQTPTPGAPTSGKPLAPLELSPGAPGPPLGPGTPGGKRPVETPKKKVGPAAPPQAAPSVDPKKAALMDKLKQRKQTLSGRPSANSL